MMRRTPVKNYFFISKRERWGLTLPGVALLLLSLVLIIFLFIRNLYPILAPTEKIDASILVLEGAVNDYVLSEAIREFRTGRYELLITTGTPLEFGSVLSEYKNTANIVGLSLLRMGFDSTKLVMAGTDAIIHDRTYNSAIRLKEWLMEHRPDVSAVNVMSLGVHGGRSRLLFRAALGDHFSVGIISVANIYYTKDNWWRSSKGFRETMNEALGFFYTKFFFRPYENELTKK